MDITEELRAFVATAKTSSFTAAAQMLGVSNRLTSRHVAELETRLGARLFQRTTRKVGLTPAGEELLARVAPLLDDLDQMLAEVSERTRGYTGVIRVTAPVTFGEIYVGRMLARFAAQNPGVTFDLRLTDTFSDLAREGIDLAFRAGRSDMLSLKTRKLGEISSLAVASPAYLAAHGTPRTPEELGQHICILDTNRQTPRRWTFFRGTEDHEAIVQGSFYVNSARAAVDMATAGLGIAYAPRFALCDALNSGTLVPLLPDFTGESTALKAAYLEGRVLPRKVRALIDFAVQDIRTSNIL